MHGPSGEREDLHVHTHLSDGLADPAAVVRRASALGLERIAITDHDGVDAHRERAWAADGVPRVEVVTGVEIDCTLLARDVEVLGYEFDPEAPQLVEALARIQEERRARFGFYARGLARAGEPIDPDGAPDAATRAPLKVHIFRALQARGRAFPGGYAEFKRRLAELGPPPPLHRPTAAEAVRRVREAGGWAVLAHPGYYARSAAWPAVLDAAREAGCAGVEAVYPYDADTPPPPAESVARDLLAMREAIRAVFPAGVRLTSGTDVHDLDEWEPRLARVARWRRVVGLPVA